MMVDFSILFTIHYPDHGRVEPIPADSVPEEQNKLAINHNAETNRKPLRNVNNLNCVF